MRPDSTAASTSRLLSARQWSRRREGTSVLQAPRAPRASRSASARPTATTPRTSTSRRSRCAPARACRRATASAPSGRLAPAQSQRRTCTSASATREPTTATTTPSASCRRHRPRHPRTRRRPRQPPRPSRWHPHRHRSLPRRHCAHAPRRQGAHAPLRSGGRSHGNGPLRPGGRSHRARPPRCPAGPSGSCGVRPPRPRGSHRAPPARHASGLRPARDWRRPGSLAGLQRAQLPRRFRITAARLPIPPESEPRRRHGSSP